MAGVSFETAAARPAVDAAPLRPVRIKSSSDLPPSPSTYSVAHEQRVAYTHQTVFSSSAALEALGCGWCEEAN